MSSSDLLSIVARTVAIPSPNVTRQAGGRTHADVA